MSWSISHECDYPPSSEASSWLTDDASWMTSADMTTSPNQQRLERLYRLKTNCCGSATGSDRPTTPPLCRHTDQLHDALRSMPHQPTVLTLNSGTVHVTDDVVRTVTPRVGRRRPSPGRTCVADSRPLVLGPGHLTSPSRGLYRMALPPGVAGHCSRWSYPAGGRDVLAQPGSPRGCDVGRGPAAVPDSHMPCGFSVERTHTELFQIMQQPGQWRLSPALTEHTYLVDASSYFSRPGPRLIDGIELLAAILHQSDHDHIHKSIACRLRPVSIHQLP
jgi:iron complex transport system substrate-binding protein